MQCGKSGDVQLCNTEVKLKEIGDYENGVTVTKCLGGSLYQFFPVCRDLRSSMP